MARTIADRLGRHGSRETAIGSRAGLRRWASERQLGPFAILTVGAIVTFFPLYWMFATGVRPRSELFDANVSLWPSRFVWENFSTAWNQVPFPRFYYNSIVIALVAVAITVFINLLCGYTFAKLKFRGRNILFLLILSTLMIPIQVVLVPEFLMISWLGWVNTVAGVVAPRAAEAFGIFMVRQFMIGIPDDLIDAARIDGASEFTIFRRIVLPLSKPIIAVLAIFTFMFRWNDFAWPLVALQDKQAYTVPLGLNLLQGQYYTEWTSIMSMALVSVLPMLLVFVIFQRYFVQGIATTGLK